MPKILALLTVEADFLKAPPEAEYFEFIRSALENQASVYAPESQFATAKFQVTMFTAPAEEKPASAPAPAPAPFAPAERPVVPAPRTPTPSNKK